MIRQWLDRFLWLAMIVGLILLMSAGCCASSANQKIHAEDTDEEKFSVLTQNKTTDPSETSLIEIKVPEGSEEKPPREREIMRIKQGGGILEVEERSDSVPVEEADDTDFVRVKDYIPDIEVLLIYATDQNFTGEIIYPFTEAYLRYGTVKKLAAAQEALKQQGYRIMIWDAFRPVSAQFVLWDVVPDPRYVADPRTGYSSHSRGNTIDLTIVTLSGDEVEMPTGFDDFSYLADRDYSDCSDIAASHAIMLEDIMMDAGFEPYSGEWWHFSDFDDYPVEEDFEPPASTY